MFAYCVVDHSISSKSVCVTGRYRQHTLIVYLFDATGAEQEKTDEVEETAVENKEE